MTATTHIHILSTNVCSLEQKLQLIASIQGYNDIHEVSIDLEDCDKVLRAITSADLTTLVSRINNQGVQCAELP